MTELKRNGTPAGPLRTRPSTRDAISKQQAKNANIKEEEPKPSNEKIIHREKAEDRDTVEQTGFDAEDAARDFYYPLTVKNDYPAIIVFQVLKIEPESVLGDIANSAGRIYDQVSNSLGEGIDSLQSNFESKKTTADKKAARKIQNEKQQALRDAKIPKTGLVSFENNTGGEPLGRITLPLQQPLEFSDAASYNSANLGTIGGALEGMMQGSNPFAGISEQQGLLGTAGALAGQVVAKNAGAIAGTLAGSSGGLGGSVIGAVAGSNVGEGLGGAVKSATRVTSQPNERTLFEKVSMRKFGFNWKMIARSAEEQQQVKNIVKMFRQELYPEQISIGSSGVPLAYKFPNVFQIEVKNRQSKDLGFKFQRCYLETVNVTFNETARSLYSDGNFIEVSISLGFTEIIALHKDKIRRGY